MGGDFIFRHTFDEKKPCLACRHKLQLIRNRNKHSVLVCRNNLVLLFFSFFCPSFFCHSATGSMINVIFHSLSPQEYDSSHRNPSSSSSAPRRNSFFSSPGKSGCVNLPGGGISAPIFPPPPTFARRTKFPCPPPCQALKFCVPGQARMCARRYTHTDTHTRSVDYVIVCVLPFSVSGLLGRSKFTIRMTERRRDTRPKIRCVSIEILQ